MTRYGTWSSDDDGRGGKCASVCTQELDKNAVPSVSILTGCMHNELFNPIYEGIIPEVVGFRKGGDAYEIACVVEP